MYSCLSFEEKDNTPTWIFTLGWKQKMNDDEDYAILARMSITIKPRCHYGPCENHSLQENVDTLLPHMVLSVPAEYIPASESLFMAVTCRTMLFFTKDLKRSGSSAKTWKGSEKPAMSFFCCPVHRWLIDEKLSPTASHCSKSIALSIASFWNCYFG